MSSTNDPDVGLTLGNNRSTWLKRTARRFLAPQTKSEPQRPDSPCTPSRAHINKPKTAIASLRMHLPSSTRKHKRNSLDVVVPLPPDDRGSPTPHGRFSNDSKRYGTVPDGRRSSIADSFRSLGRKVSIIRPSLDATAEEEPEEDLEALAPVPSSPIAIPAAPPTLTLDLGIAGFDTPMLARDDGREELRDLTALREITSGRPPNNLTHPMAAQVLADPRADTPASLMNDAMRDPRSDHLSSTPMPGTNMPIELDGVAESEASPVFERSVESPEKTPRTIRSIDALAEAYKNASPSKQPVSQTRKTTASTLSKCPSDMKLLCRQPSNRSEGDATTSSESCSFVLPLRAKQQPKGVTTSAEDDENNALAACAQNLEQDAASAVVQTNLTVANDAESITTDYEEFKTQLLLEDTMPTRPATPEYYSDSSPQSLSLMPQLYQCIRDESPSPTRGAGVNSWKFKIENWIGSPTGSQSHSQGHGTRAERQSISMSIDDSSMVVERDTVSGTMTPTTTAEAISPQSDRSGLMGSRTEFQLRCSERNMRYNALHNDDFDISTQSNVQKDSVQLPEYGNAFPYADDVSGDSDKENDPRAAGKPIAIKDNIVTRDLLTTAASKALSDFTSPFDATVVRLLREHGALISSKTNLDEFGMGSHSQHSHFGPVTSLFSRSEDPTSLPTSLREKLNGSGSGQRKALRIGVPAEYNIEELSPPVRAAYSRTLSALQSAGHTLHAISLPSTRRALSAYYILAPAEASSNLAKYDGVRYGHRTSSGPDAAPTTQNLPLYAQTRGEAFGAEVQCRILLGAYTLSSEALSNYFIQAQRVRRLVQRDFDRVFARPNPLHDDHNGGGSTAPGSRREPDEADVVDIILTPTAPTLPPTLEEVRRQSPVESYMNDVFTVPASLAG
ncbi:hypothetical protein D0859_03046 [Hortaea werneckii]|uniref:Amidase domain-containing protein n=1 Tax=Hortaea werneckii TaxID=91943 RepID=A0A3M7J551_HORWE|nr:hypothetical protein D0859_03046 [Hortaea werneckii]